MSKETFSVVQILKRGMIGLLFMGYPDSLLRAEVTFTPEQQQAVEKIVRQEVQKVFKHLQESMGIAVMIAADAAAKETRQEMALKTHKGTLFQNQGQPFLGKASAQKIAIVFTDPYCGHCHQALDNFEKYAGNQKDIKLIIHNYPLFGKGSKEAVEAFLAAHLQHNYFKFYRAFRACFEKQKKTLQKDDLLRVAKEVGLNTQKFQKDVSGPEVKQLLKETIRVGKDFNITGTPTFIIQRVSNGQKGQVMEGAISPQECFEVKGQK